MEFKTIITTKILMKVQQENINTVRKALNILEDWQSEGNFHGVDEAIDQIDALLNSFDDQNEIIIGTDETVKAGILDLESVV